MHSVMFRNSVRESDTEKVASLVTETGFFNAQEVEVAAELLEERLGKGSVSGYHFLIAETPSGEILGYACFGPIPCTQSSFDLYWIVVHPEAQGQGLGKRLMAACESEIRTLGGTRVYVETSSRDQYHPTRCFYERCGYSLEAELTDFYAPRDDKLVFGKALV
jgi:ribosomal protein S18 acetylase RimI-like enzyme